MTSEILTIGDELLIGQIINTNQAYIAGKLNDIGIAVGRMTTVGDDMPAILTAFQEALARYDVTIITGGLGPTHDDITKRALCTFFECDLVPKPELKQHIQNLLQKRNIPWGSSAEEQTLFPTKAVVVPNPLGTAAGMRFEHEGRFFFVLPGVPYEMKEMIDQTVVPFLAGRVRGSAIRHLTLRTTGATESFLSEQLGNIEQLLQGSSLAFLPSPTGVRLRITVQDKTGSVADQRARDVEARIRDRVGKYVYGTGDQEIEEVLGALLAERGLHIAVAESCTGGRIADRLTNVSGSSAYVDRGVVAYSNASKTEFLGVPQELIQRVGAVSQEVAEAMASGIRTRSGSDIGLSTTGIAGPTGGSEEKPVGLVWIGYSDKTRTFARRHQFGEGRNRVKERASQAALELVRRNLLNIT